MVVGAGYLIKAVRVGGTRALARESVDELAERYVDCVCKKHGFSAAELKIPRAVRPPGATKLGSGHSRGYGVGSHRWP